MVTWLSDLNVWLYIYSTCFIYMRNLIYIYFQTGRCVWHHKWLWGLSDSIRCCVNKYTVSFSVTPYNGHLRLTFASDTHNFCSLVYHWSVIIIDPVFYKAGIDIAIGTKLTSRIFVYKTSPWSTLPLVIPEYNYLNYIAMGTITECQFIAMRMTLNFIAHLHLE